MGRMNINWLNERRKNGIWPNLKRMNINWLNARDRMPARSWIVLAVALCLCFGGCSFKEGVMLPLDEEIGNVAGSRDADMENRSGAGNLTGNKALATVSESVSSAFAIGVSGMSDIMNSGVAGTANPDITAVEGAKADPGQEAKPESYIPSRSVRPMVVYHQDKDRQLIPVTRLVKIEGTDLTNDGRGALIQAALDELVDSSMIRDELENYGLYSVLPAGTEITKLEILDDIVYIYFNGKMVNCPDKRSEQNLIASVVYTATEVEGISGVRIFVDGRFPSSQNSEVEESGVLPFGSDISGILRRQYIMINAERLFAGEGVTKLDAYVCKVLTDGHEVFLPVSWEVRKTAVDSSPAKIIDLLVRDYSPMGLKSGLDSGTKLVAGSWDRSRLILDFGTELGKNGVLDDIVAQQIFFSMMQLPGVDSVSIKVGGKERVLKAGMQMAEADSVPAFINDFVGW